MGFHFLCWLIHWDFRISSHLLCSQIRLSSILRCLSQIFSDKVLFLSFQTFMSLLSCLALSLSLCISASTSLLCLAFTFCFSLSLSFFFPFLSLCISHLNFMLPVHKEEESRSPDPTEPEIVGLVYVLVSWVSLSCREIAFHMCPVFDTIPEGFFCHTQWREIWKPLR